MADSSQPIAGSSNTFPPTSQYSAMSDSQLTKALGQITAGRSDPSQPYAPPAPANHSKNYIRNLQHWSSSVTPPPKTPQPSTMSRSRAARAPRASTLANNQTNYQTSYQQAAAPPPPPAPLLPPNPARPPLPTTPQALQSTYSSRLRTGTTLLMQPILASAAAGAPSTRQAARRGGVVNYADPGSGDDLPDAGALDSDDSDFVASGGTRTAIRSSRRGVNGGVASFHAAEGGRATPQGSRTEKAELDQSYLGMVPPRKYIKARPMPPTAHQYAPQGDLEAQAQKPTALVPIRVEFETETHRVRDCFVWNLYERLIKPEAFARTFCADLDLPLHPWAETVANQIRAQIEEHEGVASMELGVDESMDVDAPDGEVHPECRVFLSIDVQIGTFHLLDHIEWDLLSPLSPERFSQKLCAELGLSGEAVPLVAHAVHEELVKHKKDAVEWGVIGGAHEVSAPDGAGTLKDKTGLGLGWGRAPKDGRGPRVLRSVWRDWADAEEFGTKFEVLSAEEVERREIEKERASRRLRRETSKFQNSARTRRR